MEINDSLSNGSLVINNGPYYDEPYRTFSIIVDSLLILPAIAGNLIIVYFVSKSKELRNVGNYLVISLAFDDVFMGACILPYDIYVLYNTSLGQNKVLCLLRFVLHNMTGSNSIFNLFFISLERYIAIIHPFNYNKFVTYPRLIAGIIAARVYSLVMASIPLMGDHKWTPGVQCDPSRIWVTWYSYFCSLWVVCLISLTIFCYSRVIKVAFRHIDAVIKQRESVDTEGESDHKADIRKTKMMALIFGLFLLYWSPFSLVLFFQRLYKDSVVLAQAKCYSLTFIKSNCCINFIVYMSRSKAFRKNLRCFCLTKVSPDSDDGTALS
ncbi:adenosine receptor A2a-like [Octopus sinensis]|uniref:Adenosine receptor A2a-like n=1 Tax=Octopus sinensis TaxID=2607531 RepID=A0A6P7U703_9MOLL|nr:adenosine receptor A2a-like [Octopus sinensis]